MRVYIIYKLQIEYFTIYYESCMFRQTAFIGIK
jgi:hypothetical protein